jgi:multidrug efflux pump subunit AcrB
MLLTAAAVVVGSAIILTDPIFQGLAISLMAGEVASLLLSRSAVPVLYYKVWSRQKVGAAKLEQSSEAVKNCLSNNS